MLEKVSNSGLLFHFMFCENVNFGVAYGNLCSSVTNEQWARDNFNLSFLLVTLAKVGRS